jgi:hypothetical protein
MGFSMVDDTYTKHPVPTSQPDVDVLPTVNHFQHRVRAMNHVTGKPTKPEDAYGVRFAWQLDGDPPPKARICRRQPSAGGRALW